MAGAKDRSGRWQFECFTETIIFSIFDADRICQFMVSLDGRRGDKIPERRISGAEGERTTVALAAASRVCRPDRGDPGENVW